MITDKELEEQAITQALEMGNEVAKVLARTIKFEIRMRRRISALIAFMTIVAVLQVANVIDTFLTGGCGGQT